MSPSSPNKTPSSSLLTDLIMASFSKRSAEGLSSESSEEVSRGNLCGHDQSTDEQRCGKLKRATSASKALMFKISIGPLLRGPGS